jgi:hypothetical protein
VLVLPIALSMRGVARGGVIGIAAGSGFWIDVPAALVWTGVAAKVMGASGEMSTADALRGLRRRGWHIVNGLQLNSDWDIDHVAVGPGGLLVVESKWSGELWPLNGYGPRFMNATMDNAAVQAGRNAKSITEWLATADVSVSVTSVVVLWTGANRGGTGWNTWRDGHTVLVHGPDLRDWLRTELPQASLTTETGERVWSLIDKRIEEQDRDDSEADVVVPPTLWSLTAQWFIKPFGGFVVAAYAVWLTLFAHDWRVAFAATALAVVLGRWAVRFSAVRQLAIGWLLLSAVMLLVEVGILIAVAVR